MTLVPKIRQDTDQVMAKRSWQNEKATIGSFMKNFENHDHCINAEAEEKDGKDDGEVTEVVGGRKLCVNKPCKHHLRGYCKYGEQCRFVHICKYFASTGTCRYGNSCKMYILKKWRKDPKTETIWVSPKKRPILWRTVQQGRGRNNQRNTRTGTARTV